MFCHWNVGGLGVRLKKIPCACHVPQLEDPELLWLVEAFCATGGRPRLLQLPGGPPSDDEAGTADARAAVLGPHSKATYATDGGGAREEWHAPAPGPPPQLPPVPEPPPQPPPQPLPVPPPVL